MDVGYTINLCLQSPVLFLKYAYSWGLELVTNVTREYKTLYLKLGVRNENIVYSAVTFISKRKNGRPQHAIQHRYCYKWSYGEGVHSSYLQLKCHWHLSQKPPSQEYNSKLIYSLVAITFA